jgi:glycosyltransferase involved in cell wall biosynthesis
LRLRSVCLIAGGMSAGNLRLQPWRYLSEVARGLSRQGHPVLLVSDRQVDQAAVEGCQVCRLHSTRNLAGKPNRDLRRLVRERQTQVIVQHAGLTSFLHQDFALSREAVSLGIFTSPVHRPGEPFGSSFGRLVASPRLSGLHLAGSLVPRRLLAARIEKSSLQALVVQTHTTRRQLIDLAVRKPIYVIPPGVDPEWCARPAATGANDGGVVFAYFGPAQALRGFDTLLAAFDLAARQDSGLRLEAYLRIDGPEQKRKQVRYLRETRLPALRIDTGWLSPGQLAARVAQTDVVVLPFALVPSDAPLSVIESVALGLPLVTTRIACLPELASPVPHFFARPGDSASLARALLGAAEHVRVARRSGGARPLLLPARTWRQVGREWSCLIESL